MRDKILGKNYPDSICERATARPLAHQGIMPQRPRLTPAADFFASGRVTFIVSVTGTEDDGDWPWGNVHSVEAV